ncbi:hypothetical protein ASPFODRAFT_52603 [Aspergillus luchuensis CBS 106.47]|uniref:Uncharacterized protein n=1 Tax=Aspergillus luchuensis (strain CBS 106.47) TaxID=1137211 RepID=A0A1M3T2E4_ASPLC|nr:hypothetical protein ASPFODRAFT_52603 [Aspergillus luchuensis CBS 106.47]
MRVIGINSQLPLPDPVSKEEGFHEDIVGAPADFGEYVIQRAQSAAISDGEVCVMSVGGIIKPGVRIGASSLHNNFNPSQGQHSQNGHECLAIANVISQKSAAQVGRHLTRQHPDGTVHLVRKKISLSLETRYKNPILDILPWIQYIPEHITCNPPYFRVEAITLQALPEVHVPGLQLDIDLYARPCIESTVANLPCLPKLY